MYKKPELSASARALHALLKEHVQPAVTELMKVKAAVDAALSSGRDAEAVLALGQAADTLRTVLARHTLAPSYTQTMSMLAKADGARSLQALQAQKAPAATDCGGAEIVFETRLRNWSDDSGEPVAVELPAEYVLRMLRNSEHQFTVTIAPEHVGPDDLPQDAPQASVCLEVDDGVPHVMVGNDLYGGEQMVLAHTHPNGRMTAEVHRDVHVRL